MSNDSFTNYKSMCHVLAHVRDLIKKNSSGKLPSVIYFQRSRDVATRIKISIEVEDVDTFVDEMGRTWKRVS